MYSKKGAAWVSETGKKEVSKQTVAYSPRSKLGTLLPEFPNVKDLNLPASLPEEKNIWGKLLEKQIWGSFPRSLTASPGWSAVAQSWLIAISAFQIQAILLLLSPETHCQRILDTVIRANFDENTLALKFSGLKE
ncbi:Transcription factor RFX4 [Plecturocebus cupreus]